MGLAVGSKFSGVNVAAPFGMDSLDYYVFMAATVWGAAAIAVAFVAFAVTNPFALLDTSCPITINGLPLLPDFTIGSCYLENINTQNAMVRGQLDLGFTRQYTGTTPYLYFIEMQLRWG
ncbi:MAG: hypothetical protein R3C44_19940 [Chloroflexota bacterium]